MPAPVATAAYGLDLVWTDGLATPPGLGPAEPDAPSVQITWRRATAGVNREAASAEGAVLARRGRGSLVLTRAPATVLGTLPEAASPEALVHPLLALPLSFHAHWRGHGVIHGGAFEAGGHAWMVIGDKRAGKSTVLASLATRGVAIVADDLVVLDGDDVLAGPRSVDLRPDAATRFPDAVSLGYVLGNHRLRLATPAPSAPRLPLGGLFVLDWRTEPGTERRALDTRTSLELIHRQHYAGLLGPPAPSAMMALLGAPGWLVTRERTWPRVAETVELMLATAYERAPASHA